jgi:hypothetical protein
VKGNISHIADDISTEDSYNHPSMCFQSFDEHLDIPQMVCSLNDYNKPSFPSVIDAETIVSHEDILENSNSTPSVTSF